jgi:hypothetical protein
MNKFHLTTTSLSSSSPTFCVLSLNVVHFYFGCKIKNVHHHFLFGLFVLPLWFWLMVGYIFFSIWTLCNFSPNVTICAYRYLLRFLDELGESHGCFFLFLVVGICLQVFINSMHNVFFYLFF